MAVTGGKKGSTRREKVKNVPLKYLNLCDGDICCEGCGANNCAHCANNPTATVTLREAAANGFSLVTRWPRG